MNIDSVRLLQLCKARNANLMKALEVSQILSRELHLDMLLQRIMETVQQVMEAEACSLFLLDDQTGDLLFQVALGEAEEKLKNLRCVPKGSGIVGWVVEHGRALHIDNVHADSRFNPYFDQQTGFQSRDLLCAPIFYRNTCIGACQVINRRSGSFSKDDLYLLESLAQMSAVAIENARAHQQLLKQSLLEHDLQLASQLQQSFLPALPPEINGYDCAFTNQSALEVGGDFFDTFVLPDERVAYLLGDISGKGVSAALIMSRVTKDLRSEAMQGGTAGAILTRFNRMFSATTSHGMFVTVVLLILHPESGEIEYANAGHPPPIHLIDGHARMTAGASGPPAGIIPSTRYQSLQLYLGNGGSILLYTDGVTEANNPKGELLGRERLLQWLCILSFDVQDCIHDLISRIRQFTCNEPQSDDITMLILTRTIHKSP
ncbi:MAG: PP2C family protein-serine/threonine phosphatase [Mariprofundaceae bacterium]|nr:PP2C family protein-serine/threonine phosphatase [Mariprofundaceae bacterium]